MSAKYELVRVIMNTNDPAHILGAAVSFFRMSSLEGRRIADAIDETVKRELEVMKVEEQYRKE